MGSAASTKRPVPNTEMRQAYERSMQIEQELAKFKNLENKTIKLLLLGGAESGKSTIAKQMRILHLNGFTEHDLIHYKHLIHSNIISAFQQLVDVTQTLKISTTQKEKALMKSLKQLSDPLKQTCCEISPQILYIIKALWPSECLKEAYNRRGEFHLLDSAKYFLDDVDRICDKNYVPSSQDILRSRAATSGIHEIEFTYGNYIFRMVDVGGQKSERRKWIHCFENVTAILFIASMSEYDQVLPEDGRTVI